MTARLLAGAGFALVPAWAQAHSPIPGIGHFYSGALHPLVVPAQWMALVSLGMLFGQQGLARLGLAAATLTVAVGLGLLSTAAAGSPDTDLVLLGACLVTTLLTAVARPLPQAAMAGLAAATGLLLGLGSDPDGLAGGPRWASLAGTWAGGSLCCLWCAAVIDLARKPWLKIAVRVAASWLAASALLVLALTWVGPARGSKDGPVPASAAQRA